MFTYNFQSGKIYFSNFFTTKSCIFHIIFFYAGIGLTESAQVLFSYVSKCKFDTRRVKTAYKRNISGIGYGNEFMRLEMEI